MESLPKISIITPSYNQGPFIERTILSVLNQNYPNLEYIVMDGGSTDNTLEILKKYEDRIIWKSEPDRGQSNAINKGLRISTGDIIAYLNSDDTYKPSVITKVVEQFRLHDDIYLIYGDCDIIDENDKVIGIFKGIPANQKKMLYTLRACIPQQTAFWRRHVLTTIGYFDETLHFAMDTDFFIRILKRYKSLYVPINYANHRWHRFSKSSIEKGSCANKFREDRIKILRKHGLQYLGYYYARYLFLSKIKRLIFGEKPLLRAKRGYIRFFKESL